MICLIENGRLGNQILQYVGIRDAFPDDRILLVGFKSFFQIFDCNDRNILHLSLNHHRIHQILRVFLRYLIRMRLFQVISEQVSAEKYQLTRSTALFGIAVVDEAMFWQHSSCNYNLISELTVKASVLQTARDWISSVVAEAQSHNLVFVHVRRGDYLRWPSTEKPAVLTENYYLAAMHLLSQRVSRPFFLIFSDDCEYVKRCIMPHWSGANIALSSNPVWIDFVIMSLCGYGILSASTFSLGAALVGQGLRHGAYLGPKYWAGHSQATWFPRFFKVDGIEYLDPSLFVDMGRDTEK